MLFLTSVWFYGISTIIGYLMLNPLYTYMLNIYMKTHFVNNIFKQAWVNLFAHSLMVSSISI